MSNHPRNRPHGPGWKQRGHKLHGRSVRTKAKGERAPRRVLTRRPMPLNRARATLRRRRVG